MARTGSVGAAALPGTREGIGPVRRVLVMGGAALMAGADLLVTKPGGITCSEALASGLPMLLPPLPGHEQENAEYLVRTGAAGAVDEQSVRSEAEELLFAGTGRLERMREAALAAGRPHAAKMVANEIFIFPEPNRHTGTTG